MVEDVSLHQLANNDLKLYRQWKLYIINNTQLQAIIPANNNQFIDIK